MKIEHKELYESEHDLSEHVLCRVMNNLSAVEKEIEKFSRDRESNPDICFHWTQRYLIQML